jgi:hypothetical protein
VGRALDVENCADISEGNKPRRVFSTKASDEDCCSGIIVFVIFEILVIARNAGIWRGCTSATRRGEVARERVRPWWFLARRAILESRRRPSFLRRVQFTKAPTQLRQLPQLRLTASTQLQLITASSTSRRHSVSTRPPFSIPHSSSHHTAAMPRERAISEVKEPHLISLKVLRYRSYDVPIS